MTIYSKDSINVAPKNGDDWIKNTWRPYAAWSYIVTCVMDFIVFPFLWAIFLAANKLPVTQWDPLTLKGAGLYHLAMGAILGVAAWSRGREKIAMMQQQHGFGSPENENENENERK